MSISKNSDIDQMKVNDMIHDWVYRVAPDGSLNHVSPSCEPATGYKPDDFMCDPELVFEIVHQDDRSHVKDHWEVTPSDGTFLIDFRIITSSGKLRWVEQYCLPLYGENGEFSGRRISNRDITKQKEAEEALARSESILRAILGNIPIGVIVRDSENGDIVVSNEMAETELTVAQESLRKCLDHPGRPTEDIYNQLIHSQKLLSKIIDHLPAAITYVDSGNRFVFCNQTFQSWWLLSSDQIVGKTAAEILGENNEVALDQIRDGLEGNVQEVELTHKFPDGKSRTIWSKIVPDVDINGAICGVIRLTIDITERKKAESDLRDREELFRKLFYVAPDSMAISRLEDGKYVEVNEKFTQMTGFTKEDVLGRTSREVGLWANPEEFQFVYDQISSKGYLDNFETRFRMKDGRIKMGLLSATVMELDKKPHVLGVVRDVDDIKKAHEDNSRLATALDQAAERVVITDSEGKIVYINPAFERITGYTRDEVIGKHPSIISSGQHGRSFYEDLWKTISAGNVWRGRIINKRKDGQLFHEQSTITPAKDASGAIINYVQMATDITEEESLRNQLAQSQKMEAIGTLASGIAHDFNNIIQAIMGYTELVMDDLPVESAAYSNLIKVVDSAKRSGEMVKQILTFSRRSKTEAKTIDIGPLVKEGIKFLKSAIPPTVQIKEIIQSNPGAILGDPTQIHQVLMNLCINASQAMKADKGTIVIELEQVDLDRNFASYNPPLAAGKHLRLAVSDTGCGIPSAIISKIFDPYFTTKDVGEGTGLGLSVVHGIVSNFNGAITVSTEPGKGTTFSVYFPLVEDQAQTQKRDEDSKEKTFGSEHILVVDDEQIIAELIESQLERHGYKVTITMEPHAALRILSEAPDKFSVVITDLMMPQMSGIELAEEIRLNWRDIPVIVCTGWNQKVAHEQISKAGVKAIVSKPTTMDGLAQEIRKVLDKKTEPPS